MWYDEPEFIFLSVPSPPSAPLFLLAVPEELEELLLQNETKSTGRWMLMRRKEVIIVILTEISLA